MTVEYWNSARVAEYLKVNENNLRQITFRMKRSHLAAGHTNDRCYHLTVSHAGMGTNWYKRSKVENYALFRKGEISPINEVVRDRRDQSKRFG